MHNLPEQNRARPLRFLLGIIEGILAIAFFADCFLLIAGSTRSADPPGGLSLVVLLLLFSGAHRLRTGRSLGDE